MFNIKFIIRHRYPNIYVFLQNTYGLLRQYTSREKIRHFGGLNSDKKIYVIRIRRKTLGLMGYYMAVLGHIRIACERGMFPVVDMMNYKNPYITEDECGRKNSWEFYFKQPIPEINLKDVYKSNHVVLSNLETPFEANPRKFYERVYKKNMLQEYFRMVNTYINFNSECLKILDRNFSKIFAPVFAEEGRILGVVSRGTDILGFPGHSIQPTQEELLELSKKYMEKYSCNYIFLASDSEAAISFFKSQLGEKIILTNSCKRYDSFFESKIHVLSDINFNRENDAYLKGLEYLTTVYLLSKCNVLFGSIIGSTIGAVCMNGGRYEHIEFYDKGVYGKGK